MFWLVDFRDGARAFHLSFAGSGKGVQTCSHRVSPIGVNIHHVGEHIRIKLYFLDTFTVMFAVADRCVPS